MLISMRCIGVYLELPLETTASPPLSRGLVISLGVALFCLNFFFNVIYLADFILYFRSPQNATTYRQISSANIWNTTISIVNIFVVTIFSHLYLLSAAATKKWSKVAQVLGKMEREKQFEPKDYTKFRSIFLVGLVLLFVVIKFYML